VEHKYSKQRITQTDKTQTLAGSMSAIPAH